MALAAPEEEDIKMGAKGSMQRRFWSKVRAKEMETTTQHGLDESCDFFSYLV